MSKKLARRNSGSDDLKELFVEIPFTFFRLRSEGDRLAERFGQTTSKWGLMRSLDRAGPRSVAQAARERPVARQYIQRLADELHAEGLVEFIDNPAHRRAKLMRLTPRGERLLARMAQSEIAMARRIARHFDPRAARITREVLRMLRDLLAGKDRL